MSHRFCSSLVAALLLLSSTASCVMAEKLDLSRTTPVPDDQPIPVLDFLRPALVDDPTLNASGSHIAMEMWNSDGSENLTVFDLSTQKTEVLGTRLGQLNFYAWVGDRSLIMYYAGTLCAADLGHFNRPRYLLRHCSVLLSVGASRTIQRPLVLIRQDYLEHRSDVGFVRIDAALEDIPPVANDRIDLEKRWADNNRRHIAERLPNLKEKSVYTFWTDNQDELEFAVAFEKGFPRLYRLKDGSWDGCPVDLEKIDIVSAGRSPGEVLALIPGEKGKPRTLRFMDATTGTAGEALQPEGDHDFVGSVKRVVGTGQLAGVIDRSLRPKSQWLIEPYRSLQAFLEQSFPGLAVVIHEGGSTSKRFVVETYSDRQPASFYLVDLEKKGISMIGASEPWIKAERMRPVQILKYKTRDGHMLDAFLTLPTGASGSNPVPLIVMPSGAQHSWRFNSLVQYFASRGYAVLRPNVRGAQLYRWMFEDKDAWAFNQQGDDVADAVSSLLSTGVIDAGRIGLFGRGIGALVATASAANNPALYRGLCVEDGIYDFVRILKQIGYNTDDPDYFAYVKRKIGDPRKEPEKIRALTPMDHLGQIQAKVFVIDRETSGDEANNQAEDFVSALKHSGLKPEHLQLTYRFDYQDRLKQSIEVYTKAEAFFAKTLKGAGK